jgi:hypothetical protein
VNVSNQPADQAVAHAASSRVQISLPWYVWTAAAVVMLHALLLCGVAAALAIVRREWTTHHPLLLLTVSLLWAHCSLVVTCLTRTRCPSHIKTFLIGLACLVVWTLFLTVLESSRQAVPAAGWAAAIGSQALLTALIVALFGTRFDQDSHDRRARFSIRFLLVWTTVVALMLAGGRWLTSYFGWTFTSFFAWEYFLQLQTHATANAILATGLFVSLRISQSWVARLAVAIGVSLGLIVATPMVMFLLFRPNVGISLAEIVWLMTAQAVFHLATLVPLEAMRDRRHKRLLVAHQSSAAIS